MGDVAKLTFDTSGVALHPFLLVCLFTHILLQCYASNKQPPYRLKGIAERESGLSPNYTGIHRQRKPPMQFGDEPQKKREVNTPLFH